MRYVPLLGILLAADTPTGPPPDHFADADEVASVRADARHVLVDLRSPAAYAAGHVPGAVHLDIDELRAEVDGVPEQLAPRPQLERALAGVGIDVGDEVIAIDEDAGPAAARLLWTLQSFGHAPERLRVLDGGWKAWVAEGRTASAEPGTPHGGEEPLGEEVPELRVDAAWVLAHLDHSAVLLLDVRSDAEWDAGRIPGAVHIPWQDARGPDGLLRGAPQLRELYAEALATPTVVTYCQSGMRSSVTWLVLRTLGHEDVRVYDGSWNEWGARADLPKER